MNLVRRVDAVQSRHGNIHDNDVWLQGHGLGDCLNPVSRLAHKTKAWGFAKQFTQTGEGYSVVIRDQNTQSRRDTGRFINDVLLRICVIASCYRAAGC